MIKKFTLWLFVGFLSTIAHNVLAVPAVPWPVEKIQPDGSKISVYIRGDEKVHWMESLDGYTLMYDANKYIVYAEQDADKNMIPSKNRLNLISVAPKELKKGILYSPAQVQVMKQIWEATDAPQRVGATTGKRKALVVLMGFTDRAFGKTVAEFETLFNQEGLYPSDGSSKGSVRDFFKENSYGQLDFEVTIAGPYVADNTMAYYAPEARNRAFAELAARRADADVDFHDFADNGVLETFHIIFAGYGDEAIGNGNQIWSHKWQLAAPITLDGDVKVQVYSCSPELRGKSGNETTYIGVVCHELSHVFGAPDYYDTSGNNSFDGSGSWDLMANGSWNDDGRQPGHINMFQKILYGWVTPTELNAYTEVTAMPASALNPVAYTIKANDNGEMYVLENRQKVGFDGSVPGHGLLVWHVHPNALSGRGSNASHPQQLYPVVASSSVAIPTGAGTYGLINSSGTPFPGTTDKHAFSAKTTPAMFTWTASTPIARPLTEITESDGKISFKFLDGPTVPATDLQATLVNDNNVRLSWTAADHAEVLGYRVYRDGMLIYTINSKMTTSYTHIGVINGTYEYGVSAFYEATESEKATATVTVTNGSDTYRLPPVDLQGRATGTQAVLNWTAPFNGGWKTIAGTTNLWSTGWGQALTFFAGTMWEPEHLKGLNGYEITQIQFYVNETTSGVTYRPQIWEYDYETGYLTLVRDQAYTQSPRLTTGSKNVTLNSPLTIDLSKGYLIGVEIHTVGGNCLRFDSNPIIPERNYLIFERGDGGLALLEDFGVENNFYTSAYLSLGSASPSPSITLDSRSPKTATGNNIRIPFASAKAQPGTLPTLKATKSALLDAVDAGPAKVAPALTKYIIYRDGEKIAETTTASYTDTGLAAGTTYSYCVSTAYNNGSVSEGVCIELTTLALVNAYNPIENLNAKGAGDEVILDWNAPYAGSTITYNTNTGNPSNSSNVGSATTTEAIRFEPADLKRMEGYEITKVRFHTGNSATARTYRIRIWSGGNGATPGTIIYDEPANASTTINNNAWNDVTLEYPVAVPIYEDLWIGVQIIRTAGTGNYTYPRYSGANVGSVDGKSNWMHNNTSWSKVSNVVWPISATITPADNLPTLSSYKISRDGDDLTTVPTTQLQYTDENVAPGTYNYCITALYDNAGESDPTCASATAEPPRNPYIAVDNLDAYFGAALEDNKVTLTWDAPFTGGRIGYSGTSTAGAYNMGTDIYMATRFTTEDLKKMLGMQLEKITFAALSSLNFIPSRVTVTLCVWTGGGVNGPAELVYTQPVSTYANGWNTITLTSPIDINVYEELWIGIRAQITNTSGGVTISTGTVDTGPAVVGKGDMVYLSGVWQSWTEYNASADYNWTLFGHVAPKSGSPTPPAILSNIPYETLGAQAIDKSSILSLALSKTITGAIPFTAPAAFLSAPTFASPQVVNDPEAYIVKRNGIEVATLANTIHTYEDALTETGDYTYCVIAQYAGSHESDPQCATLSFISECDALPENVTAVRTGDKVAIDWEFTPIVPREDILFSESFASGIPATWTTTDADRDTKNWYNATTAGADGTPGFANSASYDDAAITPDNWLITPQISVTEGNRLTYYIASYDGNYPDHYGVFISTTNTNTASFNTTPLLEETPTAGWQKRTIDLSAYTGENIYIAFRHFDCTNEYRINLDEVSIVKDAKPVFNLYKNGDLLDQISDGSTSYEATLTESGTLTYSVSFVGQYCESDPVSATAIESKPLTATVTVADKTYDATTDATIQSISFTGLDEGDALTVNVDYQINATFADANVADNVAVSGALTLIDDAADKYWLTATTFTLNADINPVELTITGLTADSKVYDRNTNATATGTPTLTGVINTEDVSLSGTPVYTFADANVGENIDVNTTGFTLDGTQTGNYTLTPLTLKADITPVELTITGLTANNKTYDGTTNASASGTPTLTGVLSPDQVTLTGTPIYTFVTAQKGTNLNVLVTQFYLSGPQKGNYFLTLPILSADIAVNELTVTGLIADDKEYDGTRAATASGTPILNGIAPGEDVRLAGNLIFTFIAAFIADHLDIGVHGYELEGSDKDNYSIVPFSLSAAIKPRTLTITGLTANNKVYDATTNATLAGTPQLAGGIINNEDVSLTGTPSALFVDARVADNTTVTLSGIQLTGTNKTNYNLILPELSAAITPRTLTITGLTANNKTYDGTTNASASGTAALTGLIPNDDVHLTDAPLYTFSDANTGNNIEVNVSNLHLNGNHSGNYSLTLPILSADITPAPITITPDANQQKHRLQQDPDLTYTSQGWITPDTDQSLTGALTREAGETIGTYPILQGTLDITNNNYTLHLVEGVLFTILPGVSIDPVTSPGLQIYPNPVQRGGTLFILNETPDALIRIFSPTGTLLKQQQATGVETKITLTFPSGIYILNIDGKTAKIEVR
jgi:M6 family metalloprotease-like protein